MSGGSYMMIARTMQSIDEEQRLRGIDISFRPPSLVVDLAAGASLFGHWPSGSITQRLDAYFLLWSFHIPFLAPPHKLKWFFWLKSVVVTVVAVTTIVAMISKAGGTDDIWNQEYKAHGSRDPG